MLASNTFHPRQPLLTPAFYGAEAMQVCEAPLEMLGTKTSLSVVHAH